MKVTWTRVSTVRDGNQPQIRGHLINLIRRGRRKSAFTKHRPIDIRPRGIVHPDTGLPLTTAGMWTLIEEFLDAGVPLEELRLKQPPGEKAWVFRGRMCSDSATIYVKLQLFGSSVLLRSFHEAEYGDD